MNHYNEEDTGFVVVAVMVLLAMMCVAMCCTMEICPVPIGKYVSDCINDRIGRARGAFNNLPSGTIGEIRDSCKADAECVCDKNGVCPHYNGALCTSGEMDKYFPVGGKETD